MTKMLAEGRDHARSASPRRPRRRARTRSSRSASTPPSSARRGRRSARTARRSRRSSGRSLPRVQLEGIHHISAITGDARAQRRLLHARARSAPVAKTVNQDDPSVYHLFYGDEHGHPGADLTFFEYPGAMPGRPAPGWSTGSSGASARADALDFWAERLARRGRRGRARRRRPALRRPRGARTTSWSSTRAATRR